MSMWEPFTKRARECIVLAQKEAQRLGHNYIGTEHILLGILKDGENDGALSLNAFGVTYEKASAEFALVLGKRGPAQVREMVFTDHAKHVIELAFEEARALSHNYLGTVHLTLGLIREDQSVAARIITTVGGVNHSNPLRAIRIDLVKRESSEKPKSELKSDTKSEPETEFEFEIDPEIEPDPSGLRCPHCGKRIAVVSAE